MPESDKDLDRTIQQWQWLRRMLPIVAWAMPIGALAGLVVLPWVFGPSGGSNLEGSLYAIIGAVVGLIVGATLQLPVSLLKALWGMFHKTSDRNDPCPCAAARSTRTVA